MPIIIKIEGIMHVHKRRRYHLLSRINGRTNKKEHSADSVVVHTLSLYLIHYLILILEPNFVLQRINTY